MDISRRFFLKASAAVPAVISTGGAAAVPAVAGAGIVDASGLATALVTSERKANAAMAALNIGPGFARILDSLKQMASEDGKSNPMDVLFGNGTFNWKKNFSYGAAEKDYISYLDELGVLRALQIVPKDVPIKDIFSQDILGAHIESHMRMFGWGVSDPVQSNMQREIGGYIDVFQRVFLYCDDDTTAGDLLVKGNKFLMRLAKHSLEKTSDFADSAYDKAYKLDSLSDRIKPMISDTPEGVDVLEKMRAKAGRYRKVHAWQSKRKDRERERERREYTRQQQELQRKQDDENRRLAEQRNQQRAIDERKLQERLEAEERERKAHIEADARERKENPYYKRQRLHIMLRRIERGEYAIVDRAGSLTDGRRPLRVDWLYFAQEIDPANTKAADVTLRIDGMAVVFHNEAVIKHLEQLAGRKDLYKDLHVTIPNRRLAVDLNMTEAIDYEPIA